MKTFIALILFVSLSFSQDTTIMVQTKNGDKLLMLKLPLSYFAGDTAVAPLGSGGDTQGTPLDTNKLHYEKFAAKQNTISNLSDTSKYLEGKDTVSLSNRINAAGGGSSPTGVLADEQFSILQADGTLNAASGVQTWAGTNGTAQDVFTVAANSTYRFEGIYRINTGATTHTTALAFALTTATVASFEYQVLLWSAAANAISTTQSTTHVSGVASKVVNATSTAVYTIIKFEGTFVTGTGGTITPQINFSANPTGTNLMKRGSFVSIRLIGVNTVTKAGGWN